MRPDHNIFNKQCRPTRFTTFLGVVLSRDAHQSNCGWLNTFACLHANRSSPQTDYFVSNGVLGNVSILYLLRFKMYSPPVISPIFAPFRMMSVDDSVLKSAEVFCPWLRFEHQARLDPNS